MNSEDTFLRLSRFAHFVEEEHKCVAVFNTLNLGVVLVTPDIADILKRKKVLKEDDLSPEVFEKLRKQRILIPDSRSELDDYYLVQQHLEHPRIKILYLLLTDACNLRCRYCYFENAIPIKYEFSKMSQEVAKRGIDLFEKIITRDTKEGDDSGEPQIVFYGGEPFYNWDTMEWALDYISGLLQEGKLLKETSVSINTNGTLITREMGISLSKYPFVNVALSVDGPENIHDIQRKDQVDRGTFSRVHQTIKMLQEMGIKVGISCTLANHNVDQAEEILIWLHKTYGISSIGFNILIGTAEFNSGGGRDYAEKVSDKLISCFLIARERGIYEDRIMRKVRSFVNGNIYFHDCGGYGQQIVISPDGQVGVCQAYCGSKKYFVPLTEDFDPQTHQYWIEWKSRSPLNMPQCLDCIALANCGGGCAYSADSKSGSIWAIDETFCVFSRKAITFLVKDLMRQMLSKGP